MEKTELKNKIAELINKPQMASVATVKDSKPWVRYMMLNGQPDLTLYTSTFSAARKVEQIRKNSNVDVILGGDEKNFKDPHVNIQATAEICTDIETKTKCWDEHLSQFFSGPEDPNFSVIKISPQVIEYTCGNAMKPEVYVVD
ncbi:MAG: pyridoxamine 5'-phosphate oxidase family protein [Candidatus Tantalella remota]|nr:pyridoxamine 5'-phosphate oxidase family protein [Candidatus Tantalella remota]